MTLRTQIRMGARRRQGAHLSFCWLANIFSLTPCFSWGSGDVPTRHPFQRLSAGGKPLKAVARLRPPSPTLLKQGVNGRAVNTTVRQRCLLVHTGARRQRAFTLIELLLVLVILGILAAIVVPKFAGRTEQARATAAVSQISTFGTALDAFEVDMGYYPKGKNGLVDLVHPPRDAQNWKGPYMKSEIPLDPWGHPYLYECPGKHNPSGYDLMSMGPDGRVGGDDDKTNWK